MGNVIDTFVIDTLASTAVLTFPLGSEFNFFRTSGSKVKKENNIVLSMRVDTILVERSDFTLCSLTIE